MTVLFADIRGSTALIEELDPEQALQRLEPGLQAMAKAVHEFGGTVNRMQGDGIMALFGAPLAYEDHAVRACLAARAMIDAVARLGEHNVDIRVGLNSGEVVVRAIGHDLSMDYDAVGPTTHLANRMEQLAAPGTACLTARTARQARGFVQTRPRGFVDVKGATSPVEVFELVGVAGHTRWQVRAAAHSLTPFVGRETELRVISDALLRAKDGHGQIVAVAGEAGMGKSRLVHEFLNGSGLDEHLSLSGAAMPHDGSMPYQLVAHMLRTWLRVESQDRKAEIDDRLVAALSGFDNRLNSLITPLRSLLDLPVRDAAWEGLDPVQRRQQTHDAVRSLVLQVAESTPLILLVEDMHWADVESRAILDTIVDGLGSARLLIIVTYRPEYQNQWARYSYYSLVQLRSLENRASEALLQSLLGDSADLDQLRIRVIKQTGGIPLFLEEMARTLVETGVLISEPTRFRLTKDAEDVEIPESVQIILASRIDRLPSEERTLLQIASVIGKDVRVELLQAVAALSPDRLARQLIELRAQEFLNEIRGTSGIEYTFKHALTHAVAYDSMLIRHRRALHGQVLMAIEEKFPDRLEEFTERLADHALRGEVWEKAVRYSLAAGHRANHRSAHHAAVAFFRQALDAIGHLSKDAPIVHQEIDIRLGLRVALVATGDLEQVRNYLQEAEELARSLGDERRLMPIIISRSTILNNLGDLDEAVATGLDGRAFAERLNDDACLISSGFALGQAYWNRGEFAKAEQILSDTISRHASSLGKQQGGTTGTASLMCVVSLSHTHCLTGNSKEAFRRSREALDMATETKRPYDLSYAHAAQGLAHLTIGELDGAIQHLEAASRISREHEIMLLAPHAARYLGRAYALAGRLDEAEALLVSAVKQTRLQSLTALWGWCSTTLGFTRVLRGSYGGAEDPTGGALEFARTHGYRPLEVYASRVMGIFGAQASGGTGSAQAAKMWFKNAVTLAREIGMHPEAAHSHHALGNLLASTDRPSEATAELLTALDLYGSMDMTYDAEQVNAVLAGLPEASSSVSRLLTP